MHGHKENAIFSAAWKKHFLLLLALILFLTSLTPAGSFAKVPGQKKIAEAVEEGLTQIDALPRTNASDVIGYDYYKTLPGFWEGLQRTFDFFQFRISDAFTNMGRSQYYFTMALTMCAKSEPISWANAAGLQDILGVDGDNFAFEQIMRMLELVSDERFIGQAEELLEWAKGLKAVNYSVTGLSAFCETVNQQALLASLDWNQVHYLSEAWIDYGNKELAETGRILKSLEGYSGSVKDYVAAMSILGKAGLDTIVSEAISMSLDAAAGTMALVYKAALFGVDAVTRFSVLTGNFNDMIYASEALSACKQYRDKAGKFFFFSADDEYYFGDESSLATLDADFSWLMYAGMNYAQACAVMNDTYVNYIEIGKTSLAGKAYINDTMIRRAATAKEDASRFRNQATQLKNQLDLFHYLLKHPSDEPETPDYSDVWAHYWVRVGEPETFLDITRNGDGTLNMHAHFHQVLDFTCTLDPYDYQVIDYAAPEGEIEGYLFINAMDGGTLELSILEGSPYGEPGSSTYDYFSKSFVFSTDNPPDLTKYGWSPEDVLPPDENEILTEEETLQLFSRVSERPLMAAAGAGAWEGRLKVNKDGTFTGSYEDADSNMLYQVFFSGSFSRNAEAVGNTYWLQVEKLTTQHVPGSRSTDEYGDPVTYTEAPFSVGEYMVLTLPGTPYVEIPEMVRGEIGGVYGEWNDYSRFITLTRLENGWGFFADTTRPTPTPEPTATPAPVVTPEPTAVPAPVATSLPVITPDPMPAAGATVHYDDGIFAFDAPEKAVITQNRHGDAWEVTLTLPVETTGNDADENAKSPSDGPEISFVFRIAPIASSYWQENGLSGSTPQELAQSLYEQEHDPSERRPLRMSGPFSEGDLQGFAVIFREEKRPLIQSVHSFMTWSASSYMIWTTNYTYKNTNDEKLSSLGPTLSFTAPESSLQEQPPESVTVPAPAPAAENLSSWTGYWMTRDDSMAEMVISDNGDGTLHAQAMFLMSFDFEAVLTPQADGSMYIATTYDALTGQVLRQENGTLCLTFTGGYSYNDEEATEYNDYFAQSFTFYPAAYEEMWYETPTDAAGPDDDWLGDWLLSTGSFSLLRISRENNGLRMIVSMGQQQFSGMLEKTSDTEMDVIGDDFFCSLVLSRKLNKIAMMDIGASADSVYDWMNGNSCYGVAVYSASPEVTFGIPENNMPSAGQTTSSLAVFNTPEPETAASLLPINGKPGYLQVPITYVDATSYIEGKDPTAYVPARMTDGEETTAFQFSTKTTKLGKAYLYFEFAAPATLDELWMKNGFWKNSDGKDQYTRNSRVKKMTIDVQYAGESGYKTLKTVSLKDDKARKDWKVINMTGVQNVIAVRIRIDEIYKGSKFPNDVCISEIMFVQRE